MDSTSFVFLLGGHDLEMLTIKKLLIANGFSENNNIADLSHQWGAKLSDYKSLFNDDQTFVGIELTQDIAPPLHNLNIDHHNENSHKSSSLEQVIELLKTNFGKEIELSRELQLIAANDKGYIPAMLKLKATKEEIDNIRQRDKDAQGITAEDEILAEQSLLKYKTVEKEITIVKSLTTQFATITDRLYPYHKLIVYTDSELTYYGEDAGKLPILFSKLVRQGKTYFGGGIHGYFGIKSNSLSSTKLNSLKNQIIKS